MRNRLRLAFVVLLSVSFGAVVGVAAGAAKWRRPLGDPFAKQKELIVYQAADMPPGGVVVFGDSTVARQHFERLCGLPVLNAGVPNARAADIADMIPKVMKIARPSRVIIAIGANDFLVETPTPLEPWKATLRGFPKATYVGMAPGPKSNAANGFLQSLGPYVPPTLKTSDGVHLTPEGAREWKARIPC